MADVHFFCNSI